MERDFVHVSKFLSLVLRHRPETIDLTLDAGGWANVDELLLKANVNDVPMDAEMLRDVVEHSERKRFSFNADGTMIRASYGHSIPIDFSPEITEPPEHLFYGTTVPFLPRIFEEGILPQGRMCVHLSPDERTAFEVGLRHGEPAVLTIQAHRMHGDGFTFHHTESGLWLTGQIPPQYIISPLDSMNPASPTHSA